MREAVALIDQAARERLVHPNKAARLKGQLARRVNQLTAKKK
jgi:ribosomal protein S20